MTNSVTLIRHFIVRFKMSRPFAVLRSTATCNLQLAPARSPPQPNRKSKINKIQIRAHPCRGRGAGYPAPPAQIPAGGFPAPGSSSQLALAHYFRSEPWRTSRQAGGTFTPGCAQLPEAHPSLNPQGSALRALQLVDLPVQPQQKEATRARVGEKKAQGPCR